MPRYTAVRTPAPEGLGATVACFELVAGRGSGLATAPRAGWWLLELRIFCRPPPDAVQLHLDLGCGFTSRGAAVLPVTGQGRVRDVIRLPPGVRGLGLSVRAPPGQTIEITPPQLRSLGFLGRYRYYVERVLPALWRVPLRHRARFGLTLWRSVLDLPWAYRAVPRVRRQRAPSYHRWMRLNDTLSVKDRERIRSDIQVHRKLPRFCILVLVCDGEHAAMEVTLASLSQQLYRNLAVLVLDHGPGLGGQGEMDALRARLGVQAQVTPGPLVPAVLRELNARLILGGGPDFLVVLRAGDVLAEHALYWLAVEASEHPTAGLLYSDDDSYRSAGSRGGPRFKPDWSPTLQRCGNYLGQVTAIRADVWVRCGGLDPRAPEDEGYELSLRAIDALAGRAVRHVPAVLCHRAGGRVPWIGPDAVGALQSHLRRNGIAARVEPVTAVGLRIRYALTRQPLVSIVVPTRDAARLLSRCLTSILERTTYDNWELLVVDNGSREPDALRLLEQVAENPRMRLLRDARPFNFSALSNAAAREARGEVLCLLNNDTEVISPDWLEEMLGHLLQEGVGVVGAKLLYPDGRVQHGGDILGPDGIGRHLHAFLGRDDPGYCNRAVLAQEVSAVTAACLLTWRDLYLRLRGLDERHLPIAYNDVDYCLRVREAGYLVRWTPHAELYHWESVSRAADPSPRRVQDARRAARHMRRRWGSTLKCDPYYNPNLNAERADFSLSLTPRVPKPWL